MYKRALVVAVAWLLFIVSVLPATRRDSVQKPYSGAGKDDYDIIFYGLDLNVSDSSTYLSGSVTILLKPLTALLEQVLLDFSEHLSTDSVLVNGHRVQHVHIQDELTVTLSSAGSPESLITLEIYYHGLGELSGSTTGIYNKYVSTWNKHVTWTLSESFSAKNWFPCKQSLQDKADSVYVFLSTGKDLKAGSNGLLTAEVPLPDNRVRYEWKSRYPIAYYLIFFSVSDYMDYSYYVNDEDNNDSILVQNYIYANTAYFSQNKAAIDETGEMILLYNTLFGDYPFAKEKYGHCVAPIGGGMEHQTMTTLDNFSFLLVAHELAHQWFGDYVTCGTWQDIWINEGFASYAEYLANQYLRTQEAADSWMVGCQERVKLIPTGSVYVPEEDAENENRIFDYRLSYKKGAAIIHMLRQEIGHDSLFFSTLTGFIQEYRNNSATGMDFKNHIEEATSRDFDLFFDQWYFGEGYPVMNIDWNQHNDTLYINSLQTTTATTPFFNVLFEFKVRCNDRDTLITGRQTGNYTSWQFYMPGIISSLQIDPHHWLVMKVAGITHINQEEAENRFRIVPNPARFKVNVYLANPIGNYTLYLVNSAGSMLMEKKSSALHEVIDLKNYPAGVYFIIIKEGNTFLRGKFIIN